MINQVWYYHNRDSNQIYLRAKVILIRCYFSPTSSIIMSLSYFQCPLSLPIMKTPVLVQDGCNYVKDAIIECISQDGTLPKLTPTYPCPSSTNPKHFRCKSCWAKGHHTPTAPGTPRQCRPAMRARRVGKQRGHCVDWKDSHVVLTSMNMW